MGLSHVTRAMLLTSLTVGGALYLVRASDRWTGREAREAGPAGAAMPGCRVAEVTDAGRLRLACDGAEEGADQGAEGMSARLAGLDLPRREAPACPEELAHAALAADRVRALLADGDDARLRRVATDDGGDGLAVRVMIGGEDLGARLIREGLAAEAGGENEATDWCARLKAIEASGAAGAAEE